MNDSSSFLHEAQQAGKAKEKVEISDLDAALNSITHIIDESVAQQYKDTNEDAWPQAIMKVYCHDCRNIVPAGIGKSARGAVRTVCGNCQGRKISMGREEALRSFYHLGPNEEK